MDNDHTFWSSPHPNVVHLVGQCPNEIYHSLHPSRIVILVVMKRDYPLLLLPPHHRSLHHLFLDRHIVSRLSHVVLWQSIVVGIDDDDDDDSRRHDAPNIDDDY